jgi:hypothetical protein
VTESEGYWLLNEADFGRYTKTDDYIYHERLLNNEGHSGPTLLITDRRTMLLSRGDIFGKTESEWSIRWSDLDKVDSDRNFPCQTLKIRKVSLVVMGS